VSVVVSILINDYDDCVIWSAIERELARSTAKHPNHPTDTVRRVGIVVEEAAEATVEMAQHVVDLMKAGLQVARVGNDAKPKTLDDLRKELVETAAMCVKTLRAMNKDVREGRVEP
jgi:gamma-glutamylcysteine synthetase